MKVALGYEEKFVNDFINTSHRDRLLFELKSQKKRLNALMRFSHNIDGLLINGKIYSILKKFDYSTLKSFLNEQELYVISFKFLNGAIMSVTEVLEYLDNEYMPVIVCGNNIAVIKKEFEKCSDNYYLLKNRVSKISLLK